MKPKTIFVSSATKLAALAFWSFASCSEQLPEELPNILWLTSEDNSPFLGCYGDPLATTPNLDKLAAEGFLYTHAYANAPVCAPARNAIITGVYPPSVGNQNMRSTYPLGSMMKAFPEYLRSAGYYCTNNSKTDYNTNSIDPDLVWDESSQEAHYNNRKDGQPFFAVFNSMVTHESSLHRRKPRELLRHDPGDVILPPYHPDTYDIRYDWAQYYDQIEDLDNWIGEKLQELEDNGLADNTIVFYYGDHGGVLARSKRFLYESGTRVPFIVRIPEKFKHLYPDKKPGSAVSRIISFVDLAPTLLSIVGIEIPEWMTGQAFLGRQKSPDPQYAFMFRDRMDERYDLSRAVRDKQYRYIRNYMPHRIYGQHLDYLWQAPSIRSWEETYLNGGCNEVQSRFWQSKPEEELYDTENDPWEVNNLAKDPKYAEILKRLREANKEFALKMGDTGFIPEAELTALRQGQSAYEFIRNNPNSLMPVIHAAELASIASIANLDQLIAYTRNNESAIRYWGAMGLLLLGELAMPAIADLKGLLDDGSPSVAIVAAEALFHLGIEEAATQKLLAMLDHHDMFVRTHSLNALDAILPETQYNAERLSHFVSAAKPVQDQYDVWAARWILNKWEQKSTFNSHP